MKCNWRPARGGLVVCSRSLAEIPSRSYGCPNGVHLTDLLLWAQIIRPNKFCFTLSRSMLIVKGRNSLSMRIILVTTNVLSWSSDLFSYNNYLRLDSKRKNCPFSIKYRLDIYRIELLPNHEYNTFSARAKRFQEWCNKQEADKIHYMQRHP